MDKDFVYGIKISNSDGFYDQGSEIKIYETEKLRDEVFQKDLEYFEKWEYSKGFHKSSIHFSYEHSGDWETEHEKINLLIIKT